MASPIYPGPITGKTCTGVELALAITAACVQKLQTGEGQEIESAMQAAMTYDMRTRIAVAGFGEEPAQRSGNSWGGPTDLYPCKAANGSNGANDYVYLIATTTRMWDSLCVAIDRPDLVIDPRFENEWDRREQRRRAQGRDRRLDDAAHQMGGDGPARRIWASPPAPCSTRTTCSTTPHFEERGFVHTLDHPEHGKIRLLGWAPRLSRSHVPMRRAPFLGEHTGEVLSDDLGLDTTEMQALEAAGIVGVPPAIGAK